MKFIGLVPARGGSKGIPHKNIALCAGRPLLWYTCSAALASEALSRVILSTDDQEIAEVGRNCGVEVPFFRPPEYARDETPTVLVLKHALEWLESNGERTDAIVLLQPTSPLRTARHIDEACSLFKSMGAKTVVSVTPVPHRYHPQSLMRIEDGRLISYQGNKISPQRRQDLVSLYARNGPAILICSAEVLRDGELYAEPVLAYVMEEEHAIDVDTPYDLRLAEMLLTKG